MDDLISRQAVLDKSWDCPYDGKYIQVVDVGDILELPSAQPEIIRCKDCKHFDIDHFEVVYGIPLIVAHEICMRWSNGVKTDQEGYCFLAERREDG